MTPEQEVPSPVVVVSASNNESNDMVDIPFGHEDTIKITKIRDKDNTAYITASSDSDDDIVISKLDMDNNNDININNKGKSITLFNSLV